METRRLEVETLRARLHAMRTRRETLTEPASPTGTFPSLETLGLREVETEAGPCFVREARYPLGLRYGNVSLARLPDVTGEAVAVLGRDPALRHFDVRQALFLDTETNGLAGGTGTFAFLVGVGYLEGDHFCVRQFLLRHPGDEPAMLAAIVPLLEAFPAFVTFNGKAFDVPVIETRLVLVRRPLELRSRLHFDLLHAARRLWRLRLSRCDLSTLERHVLAAERRGEEVPSWLVPHYYNTYLRTGDVGLLRGILEHNRQDVLALAALSTRMVTFYHHPQEHRVAAASDWYSLARLHEQAGRWDRAEALYREALSAPLLPALRREARRRLSLILKRQGRWDEAVAVWEQMLGQGDLFPYEELAKFYEHRARDPNRAAAFVLAALDEARAGRLRLTAGEHEALRRRLARLRRKGARPPREAEFSPLNQ